MQNFEIISQHFQPRRTVIQYVCFNIDESFPVCNIHVTNKCKLCDHNGKKTSQLIIDYLIFSLYFWKVSWFNIFWFLAGEGVHELWKSFPVRTMAASFVPDKTNQLASFNIDNLLNHSKELNTPL